MPKLATANPDILVDYILRSVDGQCPFDVIKLQQELRSLYEYKRSDFVLAMDYLCEGRFVRADQGRIFLERKGRFILKEYPQQVTFKLLEALHDMDEVSLVMPKLTHSPDYYIHCLKAVVNNFFFRLAFALFFVLQIYFKFFSGHQVVVPID